VLLENGEREWGAETSENKFRTPPPSRETIAQLREMFEADETVQNQEQFIFNVGAGDWFFKYSGRNEDVRTNSLYSYSPENFL